MPVFQGSQNQGCEVTIYRQANKPGGSTKLTGSGNQSSFPSIISCHTQATLGGGGVFAFACKPESGDTFFGTVTDDDWVDIVFTRNNLRWHVLRGLIDEVRRSRNVGASGAVVTTYTVTGRSFQKIFTDTLVYLSIGKTENFFGDLAQATANGFYGRIQDLQPRILLGVLDFLSKAKRGGYALPLGMFNTQGEFSNTVKIDSSGIGPVLPRVTPVQPFTIDNGMVWSLAQRYSDPAFSELFCDQVDMSRPLAQRYDVNGTRGLDIASTAMTVILRDKPFPVMDARLGKNVGKQSPWFNLPLFVINEQMVVSEDLGHSGAERFNAFNCAQGLDNVLLGDNPVTLFAPIWDPSDMYAHGMRRLDTRSDYGYDTTSNLGEEIFTLRRKILLKDWYCLNPIYLSGSIALGTGAPHVHIGGRLLLQGGIASEDRTFYVEGVSHTWQSPQGTRTQLTVTRGYSGSDESMLAKLAQQGSEENYVGASYGL